MNPVTSTGHSVVVVPILVPMQIWRLWISFTIYVTWSVDGYGDAAVKARIHVGWNKFGQLVPVPLLTNKDISLIRRRRLYSSCV